MIDSKIIKWLLEGDTSIRWQTYNDLTLVSYKKVMRERNKISKEGWGAKLLSYQNENGLWADSLYSRKWISTTYSMLLLKSFGLIQTNKQANKACNILLNKGFYKDEGINYFSSLKHSETCVTGMILSLLSYFLYDDERVHRLVSHLLNQQMKDGGWNCQSYSGATHSSFSYHFISIGRLMGI